MTTVEIILVIEVISTLEVRLFIKKTISQIFSNQNFHGFFRENSKIFSIFILHYQFIFSAQYVKLL